VIIRLLSRSLLFRVAAAVSAASLVMLITPSVPLQIVGILHLFMCAMILSHRATPFEAVLPVDARSFFLARICVGLALTCLPVMAWLLSGHMRGVPDASSWLLQGAPQEFRLLALPIAGLAVILPHASRPGVLPLPDRRSFPGTAWVALAIGCAAVIWLLPLSAATVVLAGAAAGTLAVTWHRMPRSYQVAPPGAQVPGRVLPAAHAAAPDAPAVRWWRPMLATVVPARTLFLLPLIGFFGTTDYWLLYLSIFALPDLMGGARARRQWLHTLPVPRTALVAVTLAPAVLLLLAVLLGGAVAGPALLPPGNALHKGAPHEYSRDRDFDRRTRVPLAFWRVAPGGKPQEARAPWGETTATDAISLPGLTLYNPYSARHASSPELVEWQFERASAAVHGRSFTTAQYFESGFVPPRRVTNSAPVYLLGGSLVLTFVILIAWLAEVGRSHSLTARPVLRYGAEAFTVTLLVGMAVLEFYVMFTHRTAFFVPVGAALALRAAAVLPNIGVVAGVAALPVVAVYSLLHWQMGRSDVTGA
jgi:hypothetical protein